MSKNPDYGYGINEGTGRGVGEGQPMPKQFIPAVEKFHAKLMDAFHALRGIKGDNSNKTLTIDGLEFSQMIAQCKKNLYNELL
jgi:hypothetical protein